MFSMDELTKKVDVDLPDDLDKDQKEELLNEIGEYIKITMLDMIGSGKSPVAGEKSKWDKLSPTYAKEKGTKMANMDLEGNMLDALDYDVVKGQLYVGWFDSDQAIKAYGHTTGMEGHPWLDGKAPVRKLIPKDEEKFRVEINKGIQEIIEDFIDANKS